jgi:hypothetical protein
MISPLIWLLILVGPFLAVAAAGVPAVASWPELLSVVFPAPRPRPRPVTRPRPPRWAVAW